MTTDYRLNGRCCPHCGGSSIRAHHVVASDTRDHEHIAIMECSGCVFAWQWPLARSVEQSVDHATQRYAVAQDHQYYDPEVRRRIADLRLEFLASLAAPGRRLLDVGAGDGKFVERALALGWDAWGVDPGAPTTAGARLQRCRVTDLPQADLYDAITLWDVIEHVEDPAGLLRDALSRLKPGGSLIIETGNYQSGERILAGERWWGFAADHRWYFSPPVLEDLMRKVGMTSFLHAQRVFRPGWQGEPRYRPWLGGHLRRALQRPARAFKELHTLLTLRRAASAWPQWSGLGIVTIAGRKP